MSKCIRQQQFIMLLYLRHFTIKIVAQTLVNSYYNASIKLFGKCFSPDRKVCIFLVKWPAMIFYVQVFDKEYVCFTEICSKNEIHFEGGKKSHFVLPLYWPSLTNPLQYQFFPKVKILLFLAFFPLKLFILLLPKAIKDQSFFRRFSEIHFAQICTTTGKVIFKCICFQKLHDAGIFFFFSQLICALVWKSLKTNLTKIPRYCVTFLLARPNHWSSVLIFSKRENSLFFGIFSTLLVYPAPSETNIRLVGFSKFHFTYRPGRANFHYLWIQILQIMLLICTIYGFPGLQICTTRKDVLFNASNIESCGTMTFFCKLFARQFVSSPYLQLGS